MRLFALFICLFSAEDIVSNIEEIKLLQRERDRQNYEEIDAIIEHMETEHEQENRAGRRQDFGYPERRRPTRNGLRAYYPDATQDPQRLSRIGPGRGLERSSAGA